MLNIPCHCNKSLLESVYYDRELSISIPTEMNTIRNQGLIILAVVSITSNEVNDAIREYPNTSTLKRSKSL